MHKLLTGILATLLLVGLGACGSDDAPTGGTTRPAESADADADADAPAAADASNPDDSVTADTITADTITADTMTADTLPMDTVVDATDPDDTFPEFEPGPVIPRLTETQSQVIHLVNQAFEADGAADQGVTIDEACLIDIVAQLSDADAQLVIDAGFDGNPELSEAGEALGDQAGDCITFDEDDIADTETSTT